MKLLFLLLALSLTVAHAQGDRIGGGGNGHAQLVVVRKKGEKPVPYEVAKSWDSGVYRNFFKLPQINGNLEPRARFNKSYGVHALEWLEILKGYSLRLHADLTKAALSTTFRLIENNILWKHEDYPDGQVDYKTYEKAAFFDGEIILSTPVMDKMGGIEDRLSKEENQGFVIIHELINAAYPDMAIKHKLDLGEMIVNIKLLRWSQKDFLAELANRDITFVLSEESFPTVIDAMNELGDDRLKDLGLLHKDGSVAEWKKIWEIILSEATLQDGIIKAAQALRDLDYGAVSTIHYLLQDLERLSIKGARTTLLDQDTLRKLDSRFYYSWRRLTLKTPALSSFLSSRRREILDKAVDEVKTMLHYPSATVENLRLLMRFSSEKNITFQLGGRIRFKCYGCYLQRERELSSDEVLEHAINEAKSLSLTKNLLDYALLMVQQMKKDLGIIDIHESWDHPDNRWRNEFSMSEGTVFQFFQEDDYCSPQKSDMSLDEVYVVRSAGRTSEHLTFRGPKYYMNFEIMKSPKKARVGQQIKIKSDPNRNFHEPHIQGCLVIIFKPSKKGL